MIEDKAEVEEDAEILFLPVEKVYRVFNGSQVDRFRRSNRFGFRLDLSRKWRSGVFEELFFNLSGTTLSRLFDHNRLGLNLEYKVAPHFKLEMGYIRIVRLPLVRNGQLYENNIFLNLGWQL